VLQRLAGSGGQGLMWTGHEESLAPETDEGLLALLGDRARPGGLGRGLLEALGQGLLLPPGAVVFRGNLATIGPDGALADRRAGRIRAGTADLLAGLREVPLQDGLRGHIYPGHEHRVVVMLQGGKLSAQVSDSDPGGEALVQRFLTPQPRADTPEAARTARGLAELLDLARAHLAAQPLNAERVQRGLQPANCVITRGAAAVDDLPRMRHATAHAALVSACPTALGVARALGLQPATSSLMTGNLDTQLDEKFKAAAMLLRERKFVVVHVKGTDIAAHDRRPLEKRDFIEAVDAALGRFLSENNELADGLRVAVSADHGTSSLSGNHLPGPVPLLVAHWNPDAEPADFDERSAQHGVLGLVRAGDLQDLLWGT
jgi:2,3-bisphosphoglycerate-independent phosphoglycerate mutase